MLTGKRLYLYTDANTLGGHEIMTAAVANTLAKRFSCDVHCAFYTPAMAGLLDASVQQLSLPFHGKEPRLRHHQQWDLTLIKRQLAAVQPHLAVISQGYIEAGLRGLFAARRAGIYTGSYIPFGQTHRALGNRYAMPRDLLSGLWYRLNQFYLTISQSQADFLQQRVQSQPIRILNNPVNLKWEPPIPPPPESALQVPCLHLAVIGRVNFKQKNQAILIEVAHRLKALSCNVIFHIVGDGPDLSRLENTVATANLQRAFVFHGWLPAPQQARLLEHQIHAVIMPSLYEGLPLAFLESVYRGKPVLSARLPFTRDYSLPDTLTFTPNDPDAIAHCICDFPNNYQASAMRTVQQEVLRLNSHYQFESDTGSAFAALFAEAERLA